MLCDFSNWSPVDCTPGRRARVSRAHPYSAFILPGRGDSVEALVPSPNSFPISVYLGGMVGGLKPKHLILGTLELPLQPPLLLLTGLAMKM